MSNSDSELFLRDINKAGVVIEEPEDTITFTYAELGIDLAEPVWKNILV